MKRIPDGEILGSRFGRLTVIREAQQKRKPCGQIVRRWECLCECGSWCEVNQNNITSGKTKSCGCLFRETVINRNTKHGFAETGMVHPVLKVWSWMKRRCSDPTNKNYYARGIKVCERWLDSKNFLDDMLPSWAPGLLIERKDNNGPYSPDNCVWATMVDQANNRSNSFWVTIGDETKTVTQWCRINGVSVSAAFGRIYRGWDPVDAVSKI